MTKLSCCTDSLQSPKLKFWYCTFQVSWIAVNFPVIFYILFWITLYIVGCCWRPIFSSWKKVDINTNNICMNSWTKIINNRIVNFHSIINCKFYLDFFLLHMEAITLFNYLFDFCWYSMEKIHISKCCFLHSVLHWKFKILWCCT